jgi:hypothetical protein
MGRLIRTPFFKENSDKDGRKMMKMRQIHRERTLIGLEDERIKEPFECLFVKADVPEQGMRELSRFSGQFQNNRQKRSLRETICQFRQSN